MTSKDKQQLFLINSLLRNNKPTTTVASTATVKESPINSNEALQVALFNQFILQPKILSQQQQSPETFRLLRGQNLETSLFNQSPKSKNSKNEETTKKKSEAKAEEEAELSIRNLTIPDFEVTTRKNNIVVEETSDLFRGILPSPWFNYLSIPAVGNSVGSFALQQSKSFSQFGNFINPILSGNFFKI